MPTTPHSPLRRAAAVALGAAAIIAVSWSPIGDEWFFAVALLGPIVHGLIAGLRGADLTTAAATWFAAGVVWLVADWVANSEDRLFHAVLAVLMAGIAALFGRLGRALRRRPAAAPGN